MLSKAFLLFIQLLVLARLLTPADFGLMALASAFIVFIQIFSDMGISNALIHHQEIDNKTLSSLFWFNILTSLTLMILMILLSSFIADIYNKPEMQGVLIISSCSLLITAIGQQLRVLSEKKMRFKTLAIVELTSTFTGVLISLIIAYKDGGIYALVLGNITISFMTTSLLWLTVSDGWRPMLRLKLSEIQKFVSFGLNMVGFNLTNAFNLQADILIGGRVLGASYLGAYSMSKELTLRLAMVINPIITRVSLPVIAQSQENNSLIKSIYLKTILMTASVNFPLYLVIAFFSPEIVSIMFGDQWIEAVPLLRTLAIWGLARSIGNPTGSLLFGLGRANLAFKWSLGVSLFFAPSLLIGSQFGVSGLSLSVMISMCILQIPLWYYLIRELCNAGFVEYFKQIALPLGLSLIAILPGYLISRFVTHNSFKLLFGFFISMTIYITLSFLLNKPWIDAVRNLLSPRHSNS